MHWSCSVHNICAFLLEVRGDMGDKMLSACRLKLTFLRDYLTQKLQTWHRGSRWWGLSQSACIDYLSQRSKVIRCHKSCRKYFFCSYGECMNETGRACRIHIGLVCCIMFMDAVKVTRSTSKFVMYSSGFLVCLKLEVKVLIYCKGWGKPWGLFSF